MNDNALPVPYQPRALPAPIEYPDNTEYWAAARRGELLVKHCEACGQAHWFPRPHCPHCGSARTVFKPSAGLGTVYSATLTRKAGPVPFVLAYVTLDEGVTMLTTLVDRELTAWRIGDRVRVRFEPTEGAGAPVPVFGPAG